MYSVYKNEKLYRDNYMYLKETTGSRALQTYNFNVSFALYLKIIIYNIRAWRTYTYVMVSTR